MDADDVVTAFSIMSAGERADILRALLENFCPECGERHGGCACEAYAATEPEQLSAAAQAPLHGDDEQEEGGFDFSGPVNLAAELANSNLDESGEDEKHAPTVIGPVG